MRALCLLGGVLLLASTVVPAAAPPATGHIEGVVRYTGTIPPPRKLATIDGWIVHRDLIVDPRSKGARDVVVCLADAPARPPVVEVEPAFVDQRELVFVPRIVAVRHGQAVRFDNSDICNHSVQAVSTVKANSFNLFVAPGKPIDHLFEPQRHPVTIGCSLHAWMRAWIYVFAHPWFAVSDTQGQFRIAHVPAGRHTLWLRHADTGWQEKRVIEVRPGRTVRFEVEWNKLPR